MSPTAPTPAPSVSRTFITPIASLELTKDVGEEFRINRVTFVSKDKLPRIRGRIGLSSRLSEIKGSLGRFHVDFFDRAPSYAIVRITDELSKSRKEAFRLVKEELAILCLSQLGYLSRRTIGNPSLLGEHSSMSVAYGLFENTGPGFNVGGRLTGPRENLILDKHWKTFQKQMFFWKLLRLLYNPNSVLEKDWRRTLTRACVLVGRSIGTPETSVAFLLDMIALEMLITKQGDKYSTELPRRIEAFLGWVGFWARRDYSKGIEDLYKKRCKFVHDGVTDISYEDLYFADNLLFNLLLNLTKCSDLFKSKKDIADFADKVEAEHLLGLKPRIRPKKFRFLDRRYLPKDHEDQY